MGSGYVVQTNRLKVRHSCRVYGVLDVQRVAGNFHISIFEGATHVNVSHVIHDLSFGPKYPGLHNPLDSIILLTRQTEFSMVPVEHSNITERLIKSFDS
ncbi:putative endoplasmic reticulum vesicle transporter [Helianthus annuus]|nr:putative endoplasmic reticulum vesicle transporter [Helianthus annuus]